MRCVVPRRLVRPSPLSRLQTGPKPRRRLDSRIGSSGNPSNSDLFDLQRRLESAVQSEDYERAAELRDVISEKLLDVESAVRFANRRFYEAFESADIQTMRSLWSRGSHVQCIHPLHGCIVGYDLVMSSWEAVFEPIISEDFSIEVENLRVVVSDRMAFVTCTEVIKSGGDVGYIQATNVFELNEGRWFIIHHHGSPQTAI